MYASLPLTGPRAEAGRPVAEGARLALAQADGRAGGIEVELEVRDDARGMLWSPAAVGANARAAAQDSGAAAYIGELDSEPTRTSLPITNDAEIVQVSPGAGAVDLTAPAQGYPDSPERYRPSGDVTFARVVAADDEVARAAADLAIDGGVRRVAVPAARGAYEKLMTAEFEAEAAAVGLEVAGGGEADAALRIEQDGGFILVARRAGQAELAVRPHTVPQGSDLGALPVEGPRSAAYAAAGYEAMQLVLQAIGAAATDEDDGEFRLRVADAILGAQRPDSILGPYSIDEDGEPDLCVQPYAGGRARKPLCPGG